MKKIKVGILILGVIFLSITFIWAAGKCLKCDKTWNQPWARDFKTCPECGTDLIQIEEKEDKDSEDVRAIKVKRVDKTFPNYYRRRVAFCIGINNYPNLPTLEYAVKDAKDIAGVLKGYDFDEVSLLTDARATKQTIVNELLRFKSESEENDLFVFYFAGHGTAVSDHEGKERGYLIPVDFKDENNIDEQGISMGLFKDICDTMPNKHILFLVDCCYSGYGLTRSYAIKKEPEGDDIREYLDAVTGARAVQLLTAGGKNDLAHEREGHGIFTSYLLDVLEGKTIHKDDGVVSTLEMASYIKQNVINKTKGRQNPAFGYLLGNGDVVFITGKQDRKKYERQMLLSMEEIEALYEESDQLKEKGKYLLADQKMTLAYNHFRRHHSKKETTKHISYLKQLCSVSSQMKKSDMLIYYTLELLKISQNEIDKVYADYVLGVAYIYKGNYNKAIEHLDKALQYRINISGEEHPNVATIYSVLGEAYYYKGDDNKAFKHLNKSLKINLKNLGSEHADVADNYNSLGVAYRRKGDQGKAIKYFKKSLKISLKNLGPEHTGIAKIYGNLGVVYGVKGVYDKAIEYFKKSLKIMLKNLGPEHPDIAAFYNNLGMAYEIKGDYDKAIEYHNKSLKIKLKTLGPEHPDVGGSYTNIGNVYRCIGDYDKAIEYYNKSLKILLKSLGPEHFHLGEVYNNLGVSYERKGNDYKAIEYYNKALQINLKNLGPNHPETKKTQNNLKFAKKRLRQ
jgi:tetratricopeptide (TPR) repeat protein